MGLFHARNAFWRGQQAQETQVLGAFGLQQVERRDRRIPGRQHRIDGNGHPRIQTLGNLAIILHRLQRFRVAVEAHEPDPRRGDQFQYPVQQAIPRTQDRDQRQLLALEHRGIHFLQRRFDPRRGQFQLAGHLIGQQQADFTQQTPKAGGRGILLTHQGQLVLDQRVVDHGQMLGHANSFPSRSRVAASQKAASAAHRLICANSSSPQPKASARRSYSCRIVV